MCIYFILNLYNLFVYGPIGKKIFIFIKNKYILGIEIKNTINIKGSLPKYNRVNHMY